MGVSSLKIKSERQLQIVKLASSGLTDKEIAVATGLSVGTLRTYWDRLRRHCQCKNRVEIIATVLQSQAAEEAVGSLLNSLPIFVWKVGLAGRVEYRNDWFAKHCGRTKPSDRCIEQLMVEIDRVLFEQEFAAAKRLKQRLEKKVLLTFESGITTLYKICISPVLDSENEISYWLGYGSEASNDADHVLNMLINLVDLPRPVTSCA